MADWDVNNIHIGEGNLTLQFDDDEAPVAIGACANHVLDFSTKLLKIETGQSLLPIEQFIIGVECKGSIDMIEASMRNLVIAFGGDPNDVEASEPAGTLSYTIKSDVVAPPSAELVYEVGRPYDKTKKFRITLYKVQSSGGLKLTFKKDKENTFKFEYTALAYTDDDSNDVGIIEMDEYGELVTP